MRTFYSLVIILMLSGHFAGPVCSAGDWKKDFSSLCGNTENAEQMTTEELDRVLEECERVRKEIERSTDPQKKVVLFRLKKSCNFYLFIKESRK